jgi:ATPase subunit of ABC transporter with duplicated ATPase domains
VPDSGSVSVSPRTATVGLLPQEPDRRPGETLTAFLARRTGVTEAQAQLDAATQALSEGTDGPDYSEALERWLDLGGADLDVRAEQVCVDLGLPPDLLDAETVHLSGGQAARASLASVLLSRYDVFLLDEPTNDLDFAGLERLERFVLGLSAGLVVVSHDREFLARTVTSVLDVDEPSRTAVLYGGGYEAYLEERARRRSQAREAYEEFDDKRSSLVVQAQRQREQSVRGALRAKRKVVGQRQGRARRAHRGRDARRVPGQGHRVAAAPPRRGRGAAQGVAAAHGGRRGTAVGGRRGGALGASWSGVPSGWGRSTCRWRTATDRPRRPERLGQDDPAGGAARRLPVASGRHSLGSGVRLGEVDQARSVFDTPSSVVEVVEQRTSWPASEVRTLLAKYGLRADHVARPAASLSPGERTRASLALLQAVGVNLLVLDEPTNHLDLPAIEQLEAALEAYTGTLLLVTHDRRLLDAVRLDRVVDVSAL